MSMQQSFYPGDRPAETLEVTPLLDLERYTSATGTVHRPDGTEAGVATVTLDVDTLDLDLSAITFDVAGVWEVRITVTGEAGTRRVAPVQVVVQDEDTGWHNLDSARRADWPDAVEMNDITLWRLLETAKGDVLEFAPVLAEGAAIPTRYQAAQLMQARNRWNSALANPATGDSGLDGFTLTVFPLDWQVKQLLRPTRGVPAHG